MNDWQTFTQLKVMVKDLAKTYLNKIVTYLNKFSQLIVKYVISIYCWLFQ